MAIGPLTGREREAHTQMGTRASQFCLQGQRPLDVDSRNPSFQNGARHPRDI